MTELFERRQSKVLGEFVMNVLYLFVVGDRGSLVTHLRLPESNCTGNASHVPSNSRARHRPAK